MDPDIRMVLVGTSTTGNTILRRRAFDSQLTLVCQKQTDEFEGETLAVIVAPGLSDTSKTEKVTRCVSLSAPGPHVFLVVVQPNEFTGEELKTVERIQTVFGDEAAHHIVVLFTHLEEDGVSLEEFINHHPRLAVFVEKCGGRYQVFDNRNQDPSQVRELLKKVNAVVQRNGGSYYTNQMLQEAEKAIREKTEQLQKENPGMKPDEARKEAEEDNEFIRGAQTEGAGVGGAAGAAVGGTAGGVVGVIAGAKAGTVAGAVAGPAGAAVGAVGGAVGGAIIGAVAGVLVGAGGGTAVGAVATVVEGVGGLAVEAVTTLVKGDCLIQ